MDCGGRAVGGVSRPKRRRGMPQARAKRRLPWKVDANRGRVIEN